MSLNQTPSAERVHIGFFGMRNAGKSSLVNAVTNQDMSIVSPVAGTTTDPVRKTMELLPLGPVVIIDTPGLDDEGDLGAQRVEKTLRTLETIDAAVLVIDGTKGMSEQDRRILQALRNGKIPHVVACSKADLEGFALIDGSASTADAAAAAHRNVVAVSSATGQGVEELKNLIAAVAAKDQEDERYVIGDLVKPGDVVVLVTPIDGSAPKKRMIMPQQMCIREVLDAHGLVCVSQETELAALLDTLKADPALVVTDSQVFGTVSQIVPDRIPLTSFSILMARYKGNLDAQLRAVAALDDLQDGDRVLISEACTHHRQCEDIGTVKIPKWITAHTGKDVTFDFTSGGHFPDDLSPYRLVVHCGGCMVTEKEMRSRMKRASLQGIPFTNYGMLIAQVNGILERATRHLP
ncbi:MAG: [FeFe] hydrogenase H-cluster maturation GTPase HydF [Coriobacteriia bacterium]|nr:[FeFe] hydrogenase H-cluster maturation GTPase HydF [Coriobacteriia bacterium]